MNNLFGLPWQHVKAADIASLLYEFNSEESKYVMDLLHIEIQAEIINDLDPDTRKKFLKIYPPSEIINFLNQLASDDTADILNELPVKEREQVLVRARARATNSRSQNFSAMRKMLPGLDGERVDQGAV